MLKSKIDVYTIDGDRNPCQSLLGQSREPKTLRANY